MSWRTACTFVAGVLATLAGALLVLLRGPVRADSAVTDRVARWWAAVWLRAAGARVVVDGLEHVEPTASYVVVSNHQSDLDPMADLRALPLSLRVLAMRELFQILIPLSLAAVTIVLALGIYTLFRGGEFGRTWSNKLMRLRVLLQFCAILVLVAAAFWMRHAR